jgi:DNA-binding Lrp family transcriptional regulator
MEGTTETAGFGHAVLVHLDDLDSAIIAALAEDARMSYARLGAKVNLSAPAVKRRVDRLLERGVIDHFTVRLDPAALGWGTEAYVEVHCTAQTSPARMRAAFEAHPEVVAASTVTGEPDAILQIRAHDMRHLEDVVERIAAESFVQRTRSSVVLSPLVRHDGPPSQAPDQP